MSQKKYAAPLRLKIEPSRSVLFVLAVAHLGALFLLLISMIPWPVKTLLISLVVISLLFTLLINQKIPLSSLNQWYPYFDNAVWKTDERWIITTKDNREFEAFLMMNSFVHPQLTIVNLKLINSPWYLRYRTLLFLADNLDAETFRRLRVRLRWYVRSEEDNLVATE